MARAPSPTLASSSASISSFRCRLSASSIAPSDTSSTSHIDSIDVVVDELKMSNTTTKTGLCYAAGFMSGFNENNGDACTPLGKDIDMVNSKLAIVGDIDFAVTMTHPRQIHELLHGTTHCIPNNLHSITVPAGGKVFFELTSEDGASVTKKRKGAAFSKLERKANFYQMLWNKEIGPKSGHPIVMQKGDVVVFAYNGIDHVAIEKYIHTLNLPFPFIPCWVSRDSVSAWGPTVRFEKAAAEAAALRAEIAEIAALKAEIAEIAAAKAEREEEIRAVLRGLGVDEEKIKKAVPPGEATKKKKRKRSKKNKETISPVPIMEAKANGKKRTKKE